MIRFLFRCLLHRPKKLSQHKHSVYKVDTGSSDEVESVATGRSSASPLPSPISLSQVTGIIVEEKPSPQRPHVDYTQGMYCEIVIPDREEGSPPLLFQNAPTSVPVRRTSCKLESWGCVDVCVSYLWER